MKRLVPVALFAAACLAAAGHAAELYKWVDEKGQVHYSDQPPAGRTAREVKDATVSVVPGPDPVTSNPAPAAAPPAPAPSPAAAPATTSSTANDDRARAERRQKLIEDCQRNRGVDCERQVDLGAYPGGGYVPDAGYYYPGYGYPPVVRPPPPPRPPAPPPKAQPTAPEPTLTPYPIHTPRGR